MVPGTNPTSSSIDNNPSVNSSSDINEEQVYLDLAYQIQLANRNSGQAPVGLPDLSLTSCIPVAEVVTGVEEPVREIGQIDRLNSRLLSAFLERINDSSTPNGGQGPQAEESSERSVKLNNATDQILYWLT